MLARIRARSRTRRRLFASDLRSQARAAKTVPPPGEASLSRFPKRSGELFLLRDGRNSRGEGDRPVEDGFRVDGMEKIIPRRKRNGPTRPWNERVRGARCSCRRCSHWVRPIRIETRAGRKEKDVDGDVLVSCDRRGTRGVISCQREGSDRMETKLTLSRRWILPNDRFVLGSVGRRIESDVRGLRERFGKDAGRRVEAGSRPSGTFHRCVLHDFQG